MLTSSNGVESKHFPLPQLCPVHHLRSSGKHPGNARRTRVVSTFPANRLHQRYSRESMRGDECAAATTSLLIYLFCGCCNSPMKSRPFWKSLAWRVYTCVAVRSLMPPARRPTGESIYERVVFYAAKLRPNLCCFPSRMTTFIIGTDLTLLFCRSKTCDAALAKHLAEGVVHIPYMPWNTQQRLPVSILFYAVCFYLREEPSCPPKCHYMRTMTICTSGS